MKIEANQGEDNACWFALIAGGLRSMRVNYVLQDEAGTSDCVGVYLVVRFAHRIHVEPSLTARAYWSAARKVP